MRIIVSIRLLIILVCSLQMLDAVSNEFPDFTYKVQPPNEKVSLRCLEGLSKTFDDLKQLNEKLAEKIVQEFEVGLCYPDDPVTMIFFTKDNHGYRDTGIIYYLLTDTNEMIYREDPNESSSVTKVFNRRLYKKFIEGPN